MITRAQLTSIGHFNQPHGIKGEINATIDYDVDLRALRCIVIDIDGINVPFFINAVRSRSASTLLVSIDGVNNETEAAAFQGKEIFALKDELPDSQDDDSQDDGFYAEDLIGYAVSDAASGLNGEIYGIDDSTENVLFMVRTTEGRNYLIPVADEFIIDIDTDKQIIEMELPQGLLDI